MPWSKIHRTKRNIKFQDMADPQHHVLQCTLSALSRRSDLDSGIYDENVDLSPVRVDNAQLDGWLVTRADWHYALGKDKQSAVFSPTQDGIVGFGGRQGSHWFKFRLHRMGYMHWPTKAWDDIGGGPDYDRANLSNTTKVKELVDGSTVTVIQKAVWSDLWFTPGGGEVSASWLGSGDGLKEIIRLNQAGRDWIKNNHPPSTPLADTYFGFVFLLDHSDIPRKVKQGILQGDEFDDDDGVSPIEFQDSLERLLAFLPISQAWVESAVSKGEAYPRVKLRKRFYVDGGNTYLLIGVRCDLLASAPEGTLCFDPTITEDVTTGSDDGMESGGTPDITSSSHNLWQSGDIGGFRYQGIALDGSETINSATKFQPVIASYADMDCDLYCEDEDDPGTFTTGSNNISGRTKTTASVAWVEALSMFTREDSPDFSGPVQEVIDRGGWASGQDMVVLLAYKGTPDVEWFTYNSDPGDAADLYIDYTAGGGPTTYYITPAGSIAPTGGLVNRTQKGVAGSLGLTGALLQQTQKILDGSITPTGGLVNRTQKGVAGSLGLTGALLQQTRKIMSGSVTPTGSATQETQKSMDGSITPTGALSTTKVVLLSLGGTLPSAGALVRQVQKVLAGTVGSSGALVKSIQATYSGTLAPAGSLVKQIGKSFAGALTLSGALAVTKVVLESMAGALTPVGALVNQVNKAVAGTLSSSGAIVFQVGKSLTGALTPSGRLVKSIVKSFAGTIVSVGTAVLQELGVIGRDSLELTLYIDQQREMNLYIDQEKGFDLER